MELGESSTSIPRQPKRKRGGAFDGVTPHASSSSSGAVLKGPYDVFINHRGCDTKHKLASTIYHTLDLIGLRAFLDEKELELGDSIPQEIQEAMRTSGLHIAIFSERYAESPWCLAELCFMVNSGIPIIPVFYHVKPDDLRWVAQGKGCYAHAFSQHEEKGRYSSTIVEDWKSALQKVSNLSGYMLNSPNDDEGKLSDERKFSDEGKLLKSIVNSVLGTMKKLPLAVAKHPVAMDEIVEDFERSQGNSVQGEQRVQIVGIVGFGGSGKTTLATELYNRKSSSFDRSSFLHDVRDAAYKNALDTKQKKLLEDLHIQNVKNFDNSKEGRGVVADRLKGLGRLRVLIVLDDVDHEDQLDDLLSAKESLGSESLVIVTTREGDVLLKWSITSIYKIKPLQHLHASNLFCWHAFLQPFPQQGFEDLVKNCLDICSGLPLSLKVIGGQLYGKRSREYWVSQIEKIRRIFPKEILQRLKVSYDALDEDEKEMFLDVACFFIGERRSSAIAVWDGSGWSGLCSWETLLNKCLVEVYYDRFGEECIGMHDHLRDLGRQIAKTHSPSRIWDKVHIQPGMPVRGITRKSLFKEYMKMMRNSNVRIGLQLLEVDWNDLTQECGELSRGLLWLRWSRFRHRNIPQWLSLENIRVLSLSDSYKTLESLWEDDHAPLELRELEIENVDKLRSLPRSIGHLKHLKRLDVTSSMRYGSLLSSLPEEFCRLQSLEHLVLREWAQLLYLPNRFGDLVNLRHIDLSGCGGLNMLPPSFKQLIHLEYLRLRYCDNLTLERDILDNMTKLRVINFSDCRKLQVLPRNITSQAYLRELDFSYTCLMELPASIDQLSELKELLIIDMSKLTRLPFALGNLSNLITLKLVKCPELYDMPSLAGLVSLNNLHVEDCPQLYTMPSLAGLVSLSNLCVQGCPGIMKIEGLENLTSLEKLIVGTDWKVPGIHSLRCAERLRTLTLQAVDISAFGACFESIQMEKWPCQMTICGKIRHGVGSILDHFTFPGLVVMKEMKYDMFDEFDYHGVLTQTWSLVWKDTYPSNAAIFCYRVWNCGSSTETITIEGIERTEVRVREGEWILMTVLREVPHVTDKCVVVSVEQQYDEHWFVLGGWLIVGERGDVIAGFKQLVQTLRSASHD